MKKSELKSLIKEVMDEMVNEKITAKTPTGDVIDDFVHSKNSKFAGKSKEERIKMALGASYGMKNKDK